MRDKYFLDTNIIVYSFDERDKNKQNISRELIKKALKSKSGIISYQVIQEFLNVALSKFTNKISIDDASRYIIDVLMPLCEVFSSIDFYERSLEIHKKTGFSFYDSLIITAAVIGNCSVIYSEDMQHERIIEDLQIINPFANKRMPV